MGRAKKMSKEKRQERTEKRAARRKLRHAKRGMERLARTQAWLDRNGIFGKAEWIDWEVTKETGKLTFSVDPDEFNAYFEEQRIKLGITEEEAEANIAMAKAMREAMREVAGVDVPSSETEGDGSDGDEPADVVPEDEGPAEAEAGASEDADMIQ